MTVHHGGKVGKAGKTLAKKSSSKQSKSKAGTTLANHKAKCHWWLLQTWVCLKKALFFTKLIRKVIYVEVKIIWNNIVSKERE